jgi:hypothetical protein
MSDTDNSQDPCQPSKRIVIKTADDAWHQLRLIVNGEVPDQVELIFDGWPNYDVVVKGRDWNGTVPTRVMQPLLDLQEDVNRLFAQVYYGESSLRRLSDAEREALELIVQVRHGSADYRTPLDAQLTEIAKKVIGKMDSKHVMGTLICAALTWGSIEINKAWVSKLQEDKKVEQTVELSKQETERLRLFGEAMNNRPVIGKTLADHEAMKNRLLKTLKPSDSIKTLGAELTGVQASEIVQTERAASEQLDMQEDFYVLANDASRPSGFRIKVHRASDGLVFLADVPIELGHDEKKLIQAAEWSKGGRKVKLYVKAVQLRGKIFQATVYGAKASSI